MPFHQRAQFHPAAAVAAWALGVVLLSNSTGIRADAAAPPADAPPADDPAIEMLKPLDRGRDLASQQVTDFANWLDSFFGDDRIYQESQNSRLTLNLLHVNREGKQPRYDANVQGKLTLPNTERRVKLLFESNQEDRQAQDASLLDTVDSQEQSVGLRFIKKTTAWWRAHTDIGVRFRGGLDSFVRFRLRRLFELGPWNLRVTQSLFWYDSTGPGETTRFDAEWRIATSYLFRASSQATWLDQNRYFDLSQYFFLFHDISRRRAVIYQAGVIGVTEPDPQTRSYALSARLRQQLHRDWLFFEISPRIDYLRENTFQPQRSLTLRLEVIFGAT